MSPDEPISYKLVGKNLNSMKGVEEYNMKYFKSMWNSNLKKTKYVFFWLNAILLNKYFPTNFFLCLYFQFQVCLILTPGLTRNCKFDFFLNSCNLKNAYYY